MIKQVIISAHQLGKSFGEKNNQETIFSHLNLEIYQGDFTVIMGASGAGKSTLLYSLSGMDKPTEGEVYIDGTNITQMTSDQLAKFRRKQCGFVFQQIYLMQEQNLMDNVLIAGTLLTRKRKELLAQAKNLFAQVAISEQTQAKLPSQVSGGEAQRAGIVRAIINQPNILFADEPTGALSSANSDAVLDVFSSLHQGGQSIVMVTHDKKSALRGNRIIYLKDGKIFGECQFDEALGDKERQKKFDQFLLEMGW